MEIKRWPEVLRMAKFMEKKLFANSDKGGWRGMSNQFLSMRITQEKKELIRAIQQFRTPDEVWAEAADISNFAMMLADNYERHYERKYTR